MNNNFSDVLPSPPDDRAGWPWIIAPQPLLNLSRWPKISIIVPSYNQASFLEETLRSVLGQGYPNLECLVIDGGSTDGSLEILQKYAHLLRWMSEPDKGQSDAINKGFKMATGELIGWQNSDDTYEPNALYHAAKALLAHPKLDVIHGLVRHIDAQSQWVSDYPVQPVNIANMIPYSAVTNHAIFVHRRVIEAGEFLNVNLHHCMDQEWILRLLRREYKFQFNPKIKSNWRLHGESKSTGQMRVWAREAFDLCKDVYLDRALSTEIRQKAKRELFSLCHDSFSKRRFEVFHYQIRALVQLFGWRLLGTKLWVKLILSGLGEGAIAQLQKMRDRR